MVKIKWLRTAKEDVKEAIDYIALDSLKYAERQLRAIKAKTQVLKKHPRTTQRAGESYRGYLYG